MKRVPLFLIAAGLGACAGRPPAPEIEAGPLRVDAAGVLGGPAAEGGLSPEDLGARIDKLLAEGRRASAERLVRRHPDAAWLALRGGRMSSGLSAIAWFYDRHTSSQGPASGWEALMKDRIESVDRYRDYDEASERIARLLREGRAAEAADAASPEVPDDSPAGPVLRVEAARLKGTAMLLAERPAEAVAALEPGAAAARIGRPYDAAQLLLLLAEARRRSGAAEAGAAAWMEAVESAAALADRVADLFDPGFWERAANLKPAGAAWPAGVVDILRRRAERTSGTTADPEEALWACVGAQRLARGEARAALTAFTRPKASETLRLGQARALAALGQVQAARNLLVPLAAKADGRAAEAFLGALELKLGSVERAVALLRKAAEDPAAEGWCGRAEAEANLGLALLAAGQEKDGLRWLRAAQARFELSRDVEGFIQSLRNELRWAEQAGRESEAERVRERLALLESV